MGGIRFLYDNIVESLSRYSDSEGFGCILAHSMGLGKTLQVIAFIDVFLHYTSSRHVLCVVPINTIQNWVAEFNMWLPQATEINESLGTSLSHSTADNFHQPIVTLKPRNFPLFVLNDSTKTLQSRVKIVKEWREKGGVLLIGYELFRLLSLSVPCIGGNKMAVKKKKSKTLESQNVTIDLDETEKEMEQLMGKVYSLWHILSSCVQRYKQPYVILDLTLWSVMRDISSEMIPLKYQRLLRTLKQGVISCMSEIYYFFPRRRVVTTGYPIQNNLLEYWCMVDFVRPNYLGTKQEFQNLFERPIQNGQCVDSTPMVGNIGHSIFILYVRCILGRAVDATKKSCLTYSAQGFCVKVIAQ